jgi:hypothetical protein
MVINKINSRCLAPKVRSAIFDGEICAYNHVTESLTTKAVQHDIRHIPVFPLRLFVLLKFFFLGGGGRYNFCVTELDPDRDETFATVLWTNADALPSLGLEIIE